MSNLIHIHHSYNKCSHVNFDNQNLTTTLIHCPVSHTTLSNSHITLPNKNILPYLCAFPCNSRHVYVFFSYILLSFISSSSNISLFPLLIILSSAFHTYFVYFRFYVSFMIFLNFSVNPFDTKLSQKNVFDFFSILVTTKLNEVYVYTITITYFTKFVPTI